MASQADINKDILTRLEKLEKAVFSSATPKAPTGGKTLSLAEIVRKKKLENGQQKITAIVGYCEKIKGMETITLADIRAGWKEAKFDGGFANILATRAAKEGLISSYGAKDSYVLTQTGEDFWDNLLA